MCHAPQAVFLRFDESEIVAKSTENSVVMDFFAPAAPFAAFRMFSISIMQSYSMYNSTNSQPGASSFDGLGDGLAARDGILDPGADFFIVAQNFDSYGKRQTIDTMTLL